MTKDIANVNKEIEKLGKAKSFDELKNFWIKEIQANASPNLSN